jgi:hypothetical protein
MIRFFALLALLATALPSVAQAQSLEPGMRVRVHADGTFVTGTVEELQDRMLLLRTGPDALDFVERDRIERVDVSVRRERGSAVPAAVVLGGGVLLGGVVAAVSWSPCESTGFMGCLLAPESRTEAFGTGALIGGAVALPIALIVALTVRRDVWKPIELPGGQTARIQVLPSPMDGRFEVMTSVPVGHD